MTAVSVFQAKAPGIIAKLRGDFPLNAADGEAIAGNGGHESNGFSTLQEIAPTVKGSAGGFGWFQWTGPRRRAFEAYCTRNRLDPASDQANYAWLFLELKSSEKAALKKLAAAGTLNDKVIAFERSYLRAGVKNYPSRENWALKAKLAYEAAGSPVVKTPAVEQVSMLHDEGRASEARATQANAANAGVGTTGTLLGAAGATQVHHLGDWLLLGGFGVLVIGAVIVLLIAARRHAERAADLKSAAAAVARGAN